MIGPVVGGKKKKTRSLYTKRMKRYKGGCGGCALNPADFNGLDTSAMDVNVNFDKNPTLFSSKQIGGGMSYGFGNPSANEGDIKAFGGSYAPMSNTCTGGNLNTNRGGNHFMAGGGSRRRRRNRRRTGKGLTRKYKKRSSSSARKKSRGGKKTRKWFQKGCYNK